MCLLIGVVAAGLQSFGLAQEAPSVPAEDHQLLQLLHAAYPELKGQAIHIQKHPESRGLSLRVRTAPNNSNPSAVANSETLVIVSAEFDARRRLKRFRAVGELTKSRENSELARRLRKAQAEGKSLDEAIAGAGVRFSRFDRTAFETTAPWRELEDVLGAMSIESVAPEGFAVDGVDRDEIYGLRWRAGVNAVRSSGDGANYILRFEPFTGRLVEVNLR